MLVLLSVLLFSTDFSQCLISRLVSYSDDWLSLVTSHLRLWRHVQQLTNGSLRSVSGSNDVIIVVQGGRRTRALSYGGARFYLQSRPLSSLLISTYLYTSTCPQSYHPLAAGHYDHRPPPYVTGNESVKLPFKVPFGSAEAGVLPINRCRSSCR